jgi:hypothetical protein
MSWPAGQQRVLDRIEETLLADDQYLGSLFTFFTALARDDAMPRTERLPPRRLPRPALLVAAGLIAVAMFLLTLLAPGRPGCPAAAVATSALNSSAARPAAAPCRRPGQPGGSHAGLSAVRMPG